MNKALKDRTISHAEAMRRLGIGKYQILRLVQDKKLQSLRFGSRSLFYPEEVEALRKQREQESNA